MRHIPLCLVVPFVLACGPSGIVGIDNIRGRGPTEPDTTRGRGPAEPAIPVSLDAMKGAWDYTASFVTARGSATCEISGVVITVGGDPHASEILGGGWPYTFDAEASGGTLGCTGDGIEDFVQDLAPTPVELVVGVLWFRFDFTISTPLGSRRLEHAGIDRPTQSPWTRRRDNLRVYLIPEVGLIRLQTNDRDGSGQFTVVNP